MRHIFLYSFSVLSYTIALFAAGLLAGQAVERGRAKRRRLLRKRETGYFRQNLTYLN
jgi:hypothetical protein